MSMDMPVRLQFNHQETSVDLAHRCNRSPRTLARWSRLTRFRSPLGQGAGRTAPGRAAERVGRGALVTPSTI